MQIVINIDNEDYDDITLTGENTINLGVLLDLREAVRNGTLLPKGHGDLIDRKDLLRLESKWYHLRNGDVACPKIDIEHALTIIGVDEVEE
jgi:hypothetical protein